MGCMTPVEFDQSKKYLLAVSGGVDSMVLLHIAKTAGVRRIAVTHVDHGIRGDSRADAAFVRSFCESKGLEFFETKLQLGPDASEEQARDARYSFLHTLRVKHSFEVIVTAHHFDDVVETAIINIIRGTGRRGATALGDAGHIKRPLLQWTKQDVLEYAKKHQIEWREDASNHTDAYLRNRIRRSVIPSMKQSAMFDDFVYHVKELQRLNPLIDELLDHFVPKSEKIQLNRYFFAQIGQDVATEIAAHVIRVKFDVTLDRKRLKILYRFVRVGGINKECMVHPRLRIISNMNSIDIAKKDEKG